MTTKDNVYGLGKWALNFLMVVLMAILSWNFSRECDRNEKQEARIYAVEAQAIQVGYMARDISELKTDVKKLLTKAGP